MANGVRRKSLGWSMLLAALAFLVSNLGTALVNWLTTIFVTPLQTALISTSVGLGVVLLGVLIDHAKSGAQPDIGPPPVIVYPGQPVPPRPAQSRPARRTSWALALVLILVVCGGGGFGLTYGVQWAVAKGICFLDPVRHGGEPRLAKEVSTTAGPLTLEVLGVDVSECGIAVKLHAVNTGGDSLDLPVFHNSHLTIPGRTSLGGDPATSKWDDTVPPGGELSGYVVFRGDIPADVRKVTFSFSTIFGSLGGPRSISVEIPVNPPPVTPS